MSATARERFVEAMRGLMHMADPLWVAETAIEAFADATCKERACPDPDHWGDDGACEKDGNHLPKQHAACRASLRKECGL